MEAKELGRVFLEGGPLEEGHGASRGLAVSEGGGTHVSTESSYHVPVPVPVPLLPATALLSGCCS